MLGLAFYAGTANTRQLLADRTNLLLDTLEDRVETLLKPVEDAVARRRRRDRRRGDRAHPDRRPGSALCTESSPPRRRSWACVFVTPELQAYRFMRDRGALPVEDWSSLPGIREIVEPAQPGAARLGPAGLE